jgi:hypothetical protein
MALSDQEAEDAYNWGTRLLLTLAFGCCFMPSCIRAIHLFSLRKTGMARSPIWSTLQDNGGLIALLLASVVASLGLLNSILYRFGYSLVSAIGGIDVFAVVLIVFGSLAVISALIDKSLFR